MHRLTTPTSIIAFQSISPLSRTAFLSTSQSSSCKRLRPATTKSSKFPKQQQHYHSTATVRASSSSTATNNKSSSSSSSSSTEEVTVIPRANDYSAWYQSVISAADLAESAPVRGCLIIKPHGYAIWEMLRDELDKSIKSTGVSNAYFPLLIPQSFLTKESEHVEGFAKECAVVTHHRLRLSTTTNDNNNNNSSSSSSVLEPDPESRLEDPLIIRPTSETIIWHTFAKWISSYRQLPLQINQWANVVRWEMRTRPFLRTTEFLWQEGHTAHATALEAHDKAKQMINVYASVVKDMLALPVIIGVKSPSERFAGAEETYTIEAQMQNGWALQAGTSHYLGTNFPRAFDVTYTNDKGDRQYVYGTSWGATTRLLGALIMTHSDDTGLVLPPSIAPIQIAIVLIFKNEQQQQQVMTMAQEVKQRLQSITKTTQTQQQQHNKIVNNDGLRIVIDDRAGMRPGAKYYEWERKGVPLRLEIGPKDAAKNACFAACRNNRNKVSIPVDDNFETAVTDLLVSIQTTLYEDAEQRLWGRVRHVSNYDEMRAILEKDEQQQEKDFENPAGFFLVPWRCNDENERRIKEETKATLRCYPLDLQQEKDGKRCFYSNEEATHMAIFARAY